MTRCTGPSAASRPPCSSSARGQSRATAAMLWLTKSTVRPLRAVSLIRSMLRRWKAASPTASTSSISRISGRRCAATAKASRTYMPLE